MAGSRTFVFGTLLLLLLVPLTSSTSPQDYQKGGFDYDGDWIESVESEVYTEWWMHWSRDKNSNSLDDRLEWLLIQPSELQQDWWRRAPDGSARIFVDYNHHPTDADIGALNELGVNVTFRPKYLDTVIATAPFNSIISLDGIRSLPGVVMIEDVGLAEPTMHQAVPNMGVDSVWMDLGLTGTGSTVAVLDTGVRGDHEGLNDMDDQPFTSGCEQPQPNPLDPVPINFDCDPKIVAFYDAVFTDSEQPPSESYDSGTHGTHVAGIVAGTGGGQSDSVSGLRYVGAAPGAYLINILACCDGDTEDIIQGAQWAIDNKENYNIDILTSSLGEQQLEVHFDNDGNSAWSKMMDAVVEAGIITTLSAGNEFGGATFAGCNTIDSPGDARLPVTVASLDKDLGLAIYSSRGYTSDGRVKPDVATIGSNIMAPDAATQDGYTSKSGTSMATPLMAGIAALMIEANPDLSPTEFKDIISVHSIERELQLLNDPGFNDCSVLETRPDNEFGYGQADPVAFVEAAGSIDRSLNVSMDLETLDEIENESYVTGSASGVPPNTGNVEVKVGGGEWKSAADLSGDWSSWRVLLDPHEESGNSTIYARLVFSEDSISPVDARRVILVNEQSSGVLSGLSSINPMVFWFPFFAVIALIALVSVRERWDKKLGTINLSSLKKSDSIPLESESLIDRIRNFNLKDSWNDGKSLSENQFRRYLSLSILYTAQGLPAGFTAVVYPAYLYVNGFGPAEVATLWATIALPWTFKFLYGPIVDGVQFPKYGLRRPWILFAQTGMVVTLGALLFVPDLAGSVQLVTLILFVHNLFSSLQDVSVDALAVDVLQPDEVAKANGYMFAAKRVGIIASGAGLGSLVAKFGIEAAIIIQLPLLVLIMGLPLFLREKPRDKLFPWNNNSDIVLDANVSEQSVDSELENSEDEILPWLDPNNDDYKAAKWTAESLISKRVPLSSTLLWSSIFILITWMALWVLGQVLVGSTGDIFSQTSKPFKSLGLYGIIAFFLVLLIERYAEIPSIPNMFQPIPRKVINGASISAYNIVKGFSLKSSFLLIFLCLLTELYIFVDPIVGDIFINRAGWTSTEYVTLMGGWVIVFTIIGQLLGGFLGDKFGVREVAMVSWAFVAVSNAGLAMIEGVWTNTALMTIYLCFRAFLLGIAWICIISLCMRLTYSKAGGTQFTAYMSMFNLSGVVTLLLTGKLLQYIDYTSALYLGGALTLITVLLLVFIDPDECDRVLEGRISDEDQEDEFNGDFGEHSEWWEGDEPKPVSS